METQFDPLVAVLGPVGISSDRSFDSLRGHQGAFLAILAARYPNAVTQDEVIEALWPASKPASAKNVLGVALHRLRSRLPSGDVIVTEGSTYRLALPEHDLDLSRFGAAIARDHGDDRDDPEGRAAVLLQALSLWRGRPFQPFGDEPAFSGAAAELSEKRRLTEEELVDSLLASGRAGEAASRAAVLVGDEPYRERRWEQLMVAQYRCGQQVEALRTAARARATLREDLGLEISPGLAATEQSILEHDRTLLEAPSNDEVRVEALSGAPRNALPGSVPVYASAFVGRTREGEELDRLLTSGLWSSVHGPPGVGKTRLVARWSATQVDRRIMWIDLDATSGATLTEHIANELGVKETAADEVGDILASALSSVPTVIVVDNVQTPDSVQSLVHRLREHSDVVRVITISRAGLAHGPESAMRISGLDEADAAGILEDRAGLDSTEAARVIEEIGTIPLHVELFAAQLGQATAGELLDDWRGPHTPADERLTRALNWSVDHVDDHVRNIYDRFGVAGGWCSANDVAGIVGRPTPEVRQALQRLIEVGLVRSARLRGDSGRTTYRLDLSMRSHARSRLRDSRALESAQDDHAAHFHAVAISRGLQACGAEEVDAVDHLNRVRVELHLALTRLIEVDDLESAVDFVLALREYAFFRLDFAMLSWPDHVLASDRSEAEARYPELLAAAGLTAWTTDRFASAQSRAEQALQAASEAEQPPPITAYRTIVNVAASSSDAMATMAAMTELLSVAEQHGTDRDLADCLVNAAIGSTFAGDREGAQSAAFRALDLAERSLNPTSIAWAKYGVGCAELLTRAEPALVHFAEGLRLARSVQNQWVVASTLGGLATAARLSGRASEACAPLVSLLGRWVRLQKTTYVGRTLNELALNLVALDRPDEARTLLEWSAGMPADPLMLPEDRGRLRSARTAVAPPLVPDSPDATKLVSSVSELLDAAGVRID